MTLPVRQIAYYCADVRASALAHHRQFGSGPYVVADRIPLARAVHRGVECDLVHSSAYGQWGDVMIEFVQQDSPGPSPFHDLYPEGSGRFGLHHVAVWVDDVDASLADYTASGAPTALRAEMNDGLVFAFADTSAVYGHMTELYAPVAALTDFYRSVAKAARDFRGGDVITTISMG